MLKVEDFEFEPFAGRPVIKRKNQPHVIASYNKERLSFRTFETRGKKIKLIDQGALDFGSFQSGAINVIEHSNVENDTIICCGSGVVARYNMKTRYAEMKIEKHLLGNVSNFKRWKEFSLYFPEDRMARFIHFKGNHMSYFSGEKFHGDYCGGYHAYSRNVELVGNTLLFIGKEEKYNYPVVIVYDLEKTLKLEPYTDGKSFSIASADLMLEGNSGPYVKKVQGVVASDVKTENFFVRGQTLYFGNETGTIYRLDTEINKLKNTSSYTKIVDFKFEFGTLVALNFFYGNVIASEYNPSQQKAMLHLYNSKQHIISTLDIGDQRWPTHRIEMFFRRKLCFGICLNRGVNFHVFGIHLCKMVLFNARVPFDASYISGVLFLKNDRILFYGSNNYNKIYRITL